SSIASAGIVNGVIGLVLGMGYSLLCYNMLSLVASRAKKYTFKELAVEVFGPSIAWIHDILLFLFVFSILCAYVLFVGDFLGTQFTNFISDESSLSFLHNPIIVRTVVLFLVMFPLSCLTNINLLAYPSAGAVFCVIITTFYVLIRCIQKISSEGVDWDKVIIGSMSVESFNVFIIIFMAFAAQFQIPILLSSIKGTEKGRMKSMKEANGIAIAFCGAVYSLLSFSSTLAFGTDINENVLLSFPATDVGNIIAQFAMSFVVIASYPLILWPCRLAIYTVLDEIKYRSEVRRIKQELSETAKSSLLSSHGMSGKSTPSTNPHPDVEASGAHMQESRISRLSYEVSDASDLLIHHDIVDQSHIAKDDIQREGPDQSVQPPAPRRHPQLAHFSTAAGFILSPANMPSSLSLTSIAELSEEDGAHRGTMIHGDGASIGISDAVPTGSPLKTVTSQMTATSQREAKSNHPAKRSPMHLVSNKPILQVPSSTDISMIANPPVQSNIEYPSGDHRTTGGFDEGLIATLVFKPGTKIDSEGASQEEKRSFLVHCTVALGISIVAWLVGVALPSVLDIFSLFGSTLGCAVYFILPGIYWIVMSDYRDGKHPKATAEQSRPDLKVKEVFQKKNSFALVLIIAGPMMCAVVFVSTLSSLINGE
ncbi:hypothetical protein ADUPG1_000423, partial [Aduncisulcus paluster]